MSSDPTLVGKVQDVHGATVTVKLTDETITGLSFVQGEGYRIGQVGSFVRIPLGFINLYGIVTQVGAGAAPRAEGDNHPYGNRWMTVQLVGEGRPSGRFERGVSLYPTLDDSVHVVTESDLRAIYGPSDSVDFVAVGHLASAESIPTLVDINKLVTRHAAIVGATGAGKSTTVAGLLLSLSESNRYPSSRIIVMDLHGEYGKALSDRSTSFRVNCDPTRGEKPLHIPYWALTFEEFVKIGMGSCEARDLAALQDRLLTMKKAAFENQPCTGLTSDRVTVDSPIPFSVHRFWYELHCEMCATHYEKPGQSQSTKTWAVDKDGQTGNSRLGDPLTVVPPTFLPLKDESGNQEKIRLSKSPLQVRRQVDTLASRLRDPRFAFLYKPGDWLPDEEHRCPNDLDTLLENWIGSPNPITILDLSGVPTSILNDLIGALLRILYDAIFWARNLPEGGRERPLLVVLEEAHVYLGRENVGAAAAAVRRIAKEGRKYGVGLFLVSQRPSEIDPTILSQCGTLFAMRLSNDTDRAHITSAASDNLRGLFEMLPVLRTGEAIIVGEAVRLPVRTLLAPPPKNRRPDSVDPRVAVRGGVEREQDGYESPGGWNQIREKPKYSAVVEQWRRQDPHYVHVQDSPEQTQTRATGERSMEWVESPESSNVVQFGYDRDGQILGVEFKTSGTYQYFDVPEHVFEQMRQASSKGKFISQHIKGSYRYARA